jgi:hypothetical protein
MSIRIISRLPAAMRIFIKAPVSEDIELLKNYDKKASPEETAPGEACSVTGRKSAC